MNCPHCGKEIEPQQKRAAASRWAGMTAEQRAAEMSRVRKKGIRGTERSGEPSAVRRQKSGS